MPLSAPIDQNHSFPPSLQDLAFNIWETKGIKYFGDVYIDGTFASFTQLKQKYNLNNNQFFRYLQVRNFARTNLVNFP